MTQASKTAKHYDKQAQAFELYCPEHYSCLHGTVKETHELLEGYLDIGEKDNVLEIGYGRGHFGKYLIDKGVHYSGVDASEESKKIAEKPYPFAAVQRFSVGDFYDEDWKYTRIFSNEVMVHIDDHLAFFKKCASLQKSGDKMVHKEMHIVEYGAINMIDCMLRLNPIFGWTGRYHTLEMDLKWLDEAGYDVEVVNWDIDYYISTLENWLERMKAYRAKLIKMIGTVQYLKTVDTWKTFIKIWKQRKMTVNILICTKR